MANAVPLITHPDTSDATLIGAWLNDRADGPFRNTSIYTAHGTPVGGVRSEDRGTAVFNGSTGYLDCGNTASVAVGTPMTISCWIYSTSTGAFTRHIVNRGITGSINYRLLTANSTDLQFGSTAGGLVSVGTLPLNQWVHVILVYDGANALAYVNGVAGAPVAIVLSAPGASNFLIGAHESGPSMFWLGRVRDVRVYNEAKSVSWVHNEYLKGINDPSLCYYGRSELQDGSKFVQRLVTQTGRRGRFLIEGNASGYLTYTSAPDYLANSTSTDMTIVTWVYLPSTASGSNTAIIDTANNDYSGAGTGFNLIMPGTPGRIYASYGLGAANQYVQCYLTDTNLMFKNKWYFIATSYKQNTGPALYIDSNIYAGATIAYLGGATSASAHISRNSTLAVGALNGGGSPLASGVNIGAIWVFSEAKTTEFIKNFYETTKHDFV